MEKAGYYKNLFRDTLLNNFAPFWTEASPDAGYGGYLCGFDREGKLFYEDKSVWQQGRSLWMFSKLYNEFGGEEKWLRAAKSGYDFINAHCFAPDGHMYFRVTRDGRPLVLGDVLDRCDALLEAWYPGTMGGEAVAAVLTGVYNPSGKLVQTFPRAEGQVPLAYNFRRTFGYVHHRDMESGPQFPFGFGLSYTTFRYDAPRVNRTEFCRNDTVEVTVRVTNTGKVAGREIVQLYVRDEVATVVPRERELKGFLPVDLKPGESREVKFRLPSRLFMMYDNRMKWVLEPGYFRIQTGGASDSLKEVRIRFS